MASYTNKKKTKDALRGLRDLYLYVKMAQQVQPVLKDSKIRPLIEEMIGQDAKKAMNDLFAKQKYFISQVDIVFKKDEESKKYLKDMGAPGFTYLDEIALLAIEAIDDIVNHEKF